MIEYEYCPICGDHVRHPLGLFGRCPKCKGPLSPLVGLGVLSVEDEIVPSVLAVEVDDSIATADRVGV